MVDRVFPSSLEAGCEFSAVLDLRRWALLHEHCVFNKGIKVTESYYKKHEKSFSGSNPKRIKLDKFNYLQNYLLHNQQITQRLETEENQQLCSSKNKSLQQSSTETKTLNKDKFDSLPMNYQYGKGLINDKCKELKSVPLGEINVLTNDDKKNCAKRKDELTLSNKKINLSSKVKASFVGDSKQETKHRNVSRDRGLSVGIENSQELKCMKSETTATQTITGQQPPVESHSNSGPVPTEPSASECTRSQAAYRTRSDAQHNPREATLKPTNDESVDANRELITVSCTDRFNFTPASDTADRISVDALRQWSFATFPDSYGPMSFYARHFPLLLQRVPRRDKTARHDDSDSVSPCRGVRTPQISMSFFDGRRVSRDSNATSDC